MYTTDPDFIPEQHGQTATHNPSANNRNPNSTRGISTWTNDKQPLIEDPR